MPDEGNESSESEIERLSPYLKQTAVVSQGVAAPAVYSQVCPIYECGAETSVILHTYENLPFSASQEGVYCFYCLLFRHQALRLLSGASVYAASLYT